VIEVALASILSGDRYTVSWYAGRFYQLVTATVVMPAALLLLRRGSTAALGSTPRLES